LVLTTKVEGEEEEAVVEGEDASTEAVVAVVAEVVVEVVEVKMIVQPLSTGIYHHKD